MTWTLRASGVLPLKQTLTTLSVDIGGTSIRAVTLGPNAAPSSPPVSVPTPYPLPPDALVRIVGSLARASQPYDRVSVGFPGMVREGRILTAPHFVTLRGPGSPNDPSLMANWTNFALESALSGELGFPVRVANDADVHAAAVVEGRGLELVITLGTGFGTGLCYDGSLLPHMEFAHFPCFAGRTFNEEVGDAARVRLGDTEWSQRVAAAIEILRRLTFFDRCYVGGGNSRHLLGRLGPGVKIVDEGAGLRGGVALWMPNGAATVHSR